MNQRVSVAGVFPRQGRPFYTARTYFFQILSRSTAYALLIVGLAALGFCVRFYWMAVFPFREDEAIYAYWALYALHEDPWFLQVWPDKPPLFYGLLALLFRLFGDSESVVRGLNMTASTASIVVVAMTARRLWGRRAGLVAALMLTLNPLAISFASTGYTDPLLVLFGVLAIYAATLGAALWAGLCLAAAIMTKQQGLLFAPLVVGMLLLSVSSVCQPYRQGRARRRALLFLATGSFLLVGPLLLWDSLRWAVAPSPWDLAVQNYAVLTLLPPGQWPARLWQWLEFVRFVGGGWAGWGWLFTAAALAFWRWQRPALFSARTGARGSVIWLLTLWSAAFLMLHMGSNIQTWDRYLLPLVPVVALLGGGLAYLVVGEGSHWGRQRLSASPRAASTGRSLWHFLRQRWQPLLWIGGLALCLLPPAMASARGALPIGGDHGDYDGLRAVLAHVRSQVEIESELDPDLDGARIVSNRPLILYHRVLGWHYRYYLYNEIQSGQIEPRWFSHAVYLADNVAKAPFPRKLLVIPAWAPLSDLSLHLVSRGLTAHELLRAGNFVLLELSAVVGQTCYWCLCIRPSATQADVMAPIHPEDWIVQNRLISSPQMSPAQISPAQISP